ncbi:universal stress protein [Streptomyces palmae]
MPLVVGVDGSEASLEAVDWAAREARWHRAPLCLIHVADGGCPPEDQGGTAAGLTDTAVARAASGAPEVSLTSEVLRGADPAAALIERGRNALAVVLGARGRGTLEGLLVGSVSLAVAGRADCPAIVVRGAPEHRRDRFGSVVVGIEDGAGSGTALEFAHREARARGCGLVVVHAGREPLRGTAHRPFSTQDAPDGGRRRPAEVLDAALDGLGGGYPDVPVERRVVDAPARQALLAAASEADLLVVGGHRRTGHFTLHLGLVSHGVLHHAPCPVAVAPQI